MLKNFTLFVASVIALTFVFTAASAPAHAADDMKKWQVQVIKAVAKNQRYPRSAIAREIEGKAKVRLVVAADGSITSHEVVEGTGEAVLDREIPKLVEKLNPLPALPGGQDELSFLLPLTWTLN
ncbi:energy transducer TonB [Kordiimonas aestuarii]|uniref:energy transducer TonB n=1 Tax=Kordiimonas aestuarii TaxID=1005925 RepID=UPI0021D2D259|nr:TonB family protein [Kordiimonas aestuarii]